MKKNLILLGSFFLIFPFLYADVYVRGILHVKGGYRYGRVVEDINAVQEWWFSKNRVTFQSTGWNTWAMANEWRLTLDKKKKRILAINLKTNTYTEVLLDKNPLSYLDPGMEKILSNYKFNGTVEKKNKKSKYFQKSCDVYQVHEWMMEQDLRFYERIRTIWVTPDVPFDWKLFDELFDWIRSFYNPKTDYVSALKTINGFILKSDEAFTPRGGELKWDFKVVEISTKRSLTNMHDIPTDCKRLGKLTRRDLTDLRVMVYPWPIY
jgi:hypothetical protein